AVTMVEMLSARLQEVYNRWESRAEPRIVPNAQHLTYTGLRSAAHQQRQKKRQLMRESLRDSNSGGLLDIKEEPWQLDVNKECRPFMGLSCSQCALSNRNSVIARAQKEQWLHNVLVVDAQNCEHSLLSRQLCHLTTVYRLRKYDYPQTAPAIMHDERLRQAIETAAKQDCGEDADEYSKVVQQYEHRATNILYNMRSTLSDFLLRVMAWLLYKLLPCFLTSVLAHPAQIAMLKKASDTGLPLIFLPMHRSHLDYILISFILFNNNIRAPLVAAGENLRIPVFGWFLRGLGAFFIKRRMDPVQGRRDVLYRAVLHTYMVECLRAGHNIEFFIEGGRTRTGKPCLPKGGLLSVIVDAYTDGTIADALLVPVSVNYEKLVDGNFVREQLGQPKQMETFSKTVRSLWSILNSSYGMMRIDFNQPFSLRELVRSFHACNKDKPAKSSDQHKTLHSVPSSSSLYGTDIVVEEHRQLVESIARHIVHDCSESLAVMSTNAVAFLLLNKFRNGVSMERLVGAMEQLKKDLFNAGRDVGFSGDMMDVINHACDLLGPGLVKRERLNKAGEEPTITVRAFTMQPNVIELAYYSNTVLCQFVVDSVVVSALYSLLSEDLEPPVMAGNYRMLRFTTQHIQQRALDLCEILQFEFIFTKPCRQLLTTLEEAILQLKYKEILLCNEPIYSEEQQWSRRYAKTFEEYDEESGQEDEVTTDTENLMLDTRPEAQETLQFLLGLLRPLIDVYAVSALGLQRLVGRQLPERDYIQELLLEMKMQLKMGFAQFEESLSVDAMKNSLKLFECWEVLECVSQDRIKLYYLTDEFDTETIVQTVFNRIKPFKTTTASH
ncbi:hypothetical protein L9F63_011341, partial [Diploptera punctata]